MVKKKEDNVNDKENVGSSEFQISVFTNRIKNLTEHLKLNKPIYVPTSAYGHFGRVPDESVEGSFSWEKTDLVNDILESMHKS